MGGIVSYFFGNGGNEYNARREAVSPTPGSYREEPISSRSAREGQIPSRSSWEEPIPSRSAQEGQIPSRSAQGGQIPSRSFWEGQIPSRSAQEGQIPSRSSWEEPIPSRSAQGGQIPSRSLWEGQIPSRSSWEGQIPSRSAQEGQIPSRRWENPSLSRSAWAEPMKTSPDRFDRSHVTPKFKNLSPSEICYTQKSISNTFYEQGRHGGVKIGETLDDLLLGRIQINNIPQIKVCWYRERWFSLDNRRLWVLKKYVTIKGDIKIKVKVSQIGDKEKFTTTNNGSSVNVRGDPGGTYWKRFTTNWDLNF